MEISDGSSPVEHRVDDARTTSPSRTSVETLLTVGAVVVVATAGYTGFRFAARLDLGGEAGAGIVALAALTGFAAFFSPCSFPLLLGLLAGSDRAAASRPRRDGVATALAMGAGAALFLLLFGVGVGLAGEGLAHSVGFSTVGGRILRGLVAAVVITSGLVQLGLLSIPLWRVTRIAQPIERRRLAIADRHVRGAEVLYGFGFVLAGFG